MNSGGVESKLKVLFFGTPEFAKRVLEAVYCDPKFLVIGVVTQPDKPSGRGNKIVHSPVKKFCLEKSIQTFEPLKIKADEEGFLEQVREKAGVPDISLVVAFGQILPVKTLEFAKGGAVNTHASLLPRWRGAAPIQWAIIEGDSKTGVDLMEMEAGLDTGPVYAEKEVAIEQDETAGSLHDKLSVVACELVVNHLPAIASGELKGKTQDTAGVTYAAKITKEQCKIDWSKDAMQIDRLVRGLSPFHGAFTARDGKILKVYNSRVVAGFNKERAELNKAGTVGFCDKNRVEVSCGNGTTIELKCVQIEGRTKMEIAEFQKGSAFFEGERLG